MISEQRKNRYDSLNAEKILEFVFGDDYDEGLEEAYEEKYGRSYKTRSKIIFPIYKHSHGYVVKPVMATLLSGNIRQIYTLTIKTDTIDDAREYIKNTGRKLHSIMDRLANRIKVNPRKTSRYLDLEELL